MSIQPKGIGLALAWLRAWVSGEYGDDPQYVACTFRSAGSVCVALIEADFGGSGPFHADCVSGGCSRDTSPIAKEAVRLWDEVCRLNKKEVPR